ncbi:hypothetical protein FRACYDRAFT_238383 [Fragilariopsis cylindrus CCMP1102]|uniref:Uncharacterized protein n=1 Tax=Fragilariopsis cylindrus CCMP1102 TaxID=635003 RepID=A0A1E7FIF4_9STRA|nr:hypothetical protein FRACYDRAFT_238383 [Fragilariopsis cylindrus CCMP1102]|eukprot:OEU17952.1 hypothetical protein FRACYDRAFT_238383 [Fragilariopsis cylindrus CCMP1102]
MKTFFSVKVIGSITISIEPSNEDGGGGAVDVDGDDTYVLVDVFLKSLVNDAVREHTGDKGTTVTHDFHHHYDISSPMPYRRIPSDADDDRDGGKEGGEDGEEDGEFTR